MVALVCDNCLLRTSKFFNRACTCRRTFALWDNYVSEVYAFSWRQIRLRSRCYLSAFALVTVRFDAVDGKVGGARMCRTVACNQSSAMSKCTVIDFPEASVHQRLYSETVQRPK